MSKDPRFPLGFSLPEVWHIEKGSQRAFIASGSPSSHAEITSGCVIGDYEILELVGYGGSCLCYKALNHATGDIAVIKELYPYDLALKGSIIRSGADILLADGLSDADKDSVRSVYMRGFLHEVAATGSIQYHANQNGLNNDPRFFSSHVIRWDARVASGALNQEFLVIETHSGIALKDIVLRTTGEKRVLECLEITKRILESVGVLHKEKHRLHLDISPSNIYVSELKIGNSDDHSGNVMILIDYGSSFALDLDGHVKQTGDFFTASPGYLAPELAELDISKIGPQTDLFSVSKILQELLIVDSPSKGRSWKAKAQADPHLGVLSSRVADYLVNTVNGLTSINRPTDVDSMIAVLSEIENIILKKGIHPVLIADSAQKIAQSFSNVNAEMLCEVEIE